MLNSKKMQIGLKVFLSLLISLQIAVGPQLAMASSVQAPPADPAVSLNSGDQDPIWQEFVESQPTEPMELHFSPNDPAIDRDPYFLRSQGWVNNTANTTELSFRKTPGALEVVLPGNPRALHLNLPFLPVQATDQFIFFSVEEGSDLFKRAAGKESPGEGLFFINRTDLAMQAADKQIVPIFFLPLSEQGWTGKVDSVEIPESGILAVGNRVGQAYSFELRDVESMMKAQQMNLLLATALTAKTRGISGTETIYPAPGMTAAFGLFFTGMDLENPSRSLWAQTEKNSSDYKNFLLKSLQKTALYKLLMPKQAQAFDLGPEVTNRLIYVGTVLGAMLVVSWLLKVSPTGVRKKIIELRKDEPTTALGKVRRHVKETFDVFAHVTTTTGQFPSITFANATELFLDRFTPSVAAADHTLVRRFMLNTFYFARKSAQNVPVNAKTFLLGAMVMGGMDTAFVVLQYIVVVPWLCTLAGSMLGPDGKHRIDETFDPNNPDTRNIAIRDSVRNGVSYGVGGASSYSTDSRQQFIDPIEKEVDTKLRARGKDPEAPANKKIRNKMIEAKIDVLMKQRGLPGSDQFLFDANTLFNAIPKTLGYRTPEGMQTDQGFILAKRFGLTNKALKRAIQAAREESKANPSQEALDVVSILEETAGNMSFLSNGLGHGMAGLAVARNTRQQVTLLSYEGPVDWAVQYIPKTWKTRYSPAAAQGASLIFRQALYSYLSREGENLMKPTAEDQGKFADAAREKVMTEMIHDHQEDLKDLSSSEARQKVTLKWSYELGVRTQLAITQLARDEVQAAGDATYTPPKVDWVEKRQRRRAETAANEKMGAYLTTSGNQTSQLSQDQLNLLWKGFYRDSMAQQVGLKLGPIESGKNKTQLTAEEEIYHQAYNEVEKQAEETTQGQMANHDMANYLSRMGPLERLKIESALYAAAFLQAYKEVVTDQSVISPLDPAQPGILQKFRQTPWVKQSRVLTRAARLGESLFDDQALAPGWKSKFGRNIPLFADLWNSHKQVFKTSLSAMTVGYLWSYYFWQVHLPYGTWGLFVAFSASTIMVPSRFVNRAFRMNNLKAMDNVLSKMIYSVPYSWLTFFGMIPMMIYSKDVNLFYHDYIRDPISSAFVQIPFDKWMEMGVDAGVVGGGVAALSSRQSREAMGRVASAVWNPIRQLRGGSISQCSALFGSK
jgi:hypothetical protein